MQLTNTQQVILEVSIRVMAAILTAVILGLLIKKFKFIKA